MKRLCMAVMAMCLLLSCGEKREEATLSGLMKSDFVSEVEGKPTALYVLKNKNVQRLVLQTTVDAWFL